MHILCECEALASLKHIHLGSFFLDPEDIRLLGVGAIWNLVKGLGSYNMVQNRGHRGPVLKPRCLGPGEGLYPNCYSILLLLLLLLLIIIIEFNLSSLRFLVRTTFLLTLCFHSGIPISINYMYF